MRTWKEYKLTYRTEPDLFDLARVGDLRELADYIASHPQVDFDARNHRGYSALMLAVYHGHRDFAEAMLRAGSEVESADSMGNTTLMAAAFKGERGILELLIGFGADPNRHNQAGMDALDWAVTFGRRVSIQYLSGLDHGKRPAPRLISLMRLVRLALSKLLRS